MSEGWQTIRDFDGADVHYCEIGGDICVYWQYGTASVWRGPICYWLDPATGKRSVTDTREDIANAAKISPEMIEAGAEVFADYDSRFEGPEQIVVQIYRAMSAHK